MRAREGLGRIVGALLAPAFGLVARLRRARALHPAGVVYRARVTRITRVPDVPDAPDVSSSEAGLALLGKRLEGEAIVRLSGALRRRKERRPEVLGFAIRFREGSELSAEPAPGDQDLLLATVRSPFTLFSAPFATRPRSFLENRYYAVSPFDVEGAGPLKFRLRPLRPSEAQPASPRGGKDDGDSRAEEIRLAAARRSARFVLEARRTFRPGTYSPVAWVELEEELPPSRLDPAALRFSPFQAGRGIRPRGFIHALRPAAYRASQRLGPPHRQGA